MKVESADNRKESKLNIFSRLKSKLRDRSVLAKTIILSGILIAWVLLMVNARVSFDNNPVQLWVNVPSYGEAGEEFECTLEAWDWSERLSKSYNGEVSFSLISFNETNFNKLTDIEADLPDDTRFEGTWVNMGGLPPSWFFGDVGKKTFKITIDTPGIHYIAVEDDLGFKALSNPIFITEDAQEQQLLWGDIHTHSFVSDGSGWPEQVMNFARDTALLDFYALTDHGEGTGINTVEREEWKIEYNRRVTEDFNDDGEFVAFQGVELSTNFGLLD